MIYYLFICNLVEKPALMYNSGSSWFNQIQMSARSMYEGGKYTFPSLKGTLYTAPSWIPGCRLLCKMLNFWWINIAV